MKRILDWAMTRPMITSALIVIGMACVLPAFWIWPSLVAILVAGAIMIAAFAIIFVMWVEPWANRRSFNQEYEKRHAILLARRKSGGTE